MWSCSRHSYAADPQCLGVSRSLLPSSCLFLTFELSLSVTLFRMLTVLPCSGCWLYHGHFKPGNIKNLKSSGLVQVFFFSYMCKYTGVCSLMLEWVHTCIYLTQSLSKCVCVWVCVCEWERHTMAISQKMRFFRNCVSFSPFPSSAHILKLNEYVELGVGWFPNGW